MAHTLDFEIEDPVAFILDEELGVLHSVKQYALKMRQTHPEERLRSTMRVAASRLRNYSLPLDTLIGRMPSPEAEDALFLLVSQMELLYDERSTLTPWEAACVMDNIASFYRDLTRYLR